MKGLKQKAAFGTCLFISVGLIGCSVQDKSVDRSIPALVTPVKQEIKTAKVQLGTIEKKGSTTGTVTAVTKMDMSFKNKGGALAKFNVAAGDNVKKGQVIAELDTGDLDYEIKQQEIRVKQAQLSYEQAAAENGSEYAKQKLYLTLEAEKLAMEKLQQDLKGSILRAEMSGKITYAADVKLSQFIPGNEALVTISDTGNVQVQAEGALEGYALSTKASLNLKGQSYNGEVVSNNTITSGNSKVNRVIFKFIDKPKDVNIGDRIDITATLQKKEKVLLVPFKAVKYGDGNHPYVTIQENNDTLERYIEVGINDGDNVEVLNGVQEGETVIIN